VTALGAFLNSLTDAGSALDPALTRAPASVPSGLPPIVGVGEE